MKAETLMVAVLKKAHTFVDKAKTTGELADLADISLAGFEAELRKESLTATKKQQVKMFKEEVRLTAEAVKEAIKEKR